MSLELISLRCASCGSPLDEFQGKDEKKCNACGNVTMIIRPPIIHISDSVSDESDKGKLSNLIDIMTKSMIADNYKEAYEYANKALEIDSNNGEIWLAKAVSSFWLRTDESIIDSGAKEIITYLKSAKACNIDKSIYDTYAKSLAWNLFYAIYYEYLNSSPDTILSSGNMGYSSYEVVTIFSYLKLMEIAFDIHPDKFFLEVAIKEASSLVKIQWYDSEGLNCTGKDAKGLRDKLINKLKKIDPSYIAPEIRLPKKKSFFDKLFDKLFPNQNLNPKEKKWIAFIFIWIIIMIMLMIAWS